MKVVFDTNVYVSALTLPKGVAAQAFDRIVTAEHELFLSKPILDELLGHRAWLPTAHRSFSVKVSVFPGWPYTLCNAYHSLCLGCYRTPE